MATTTKVFYSPPHKALLAKRRKKHDDGRPTLTVAIPFSFSSRLQRCDRRVQSACSIRRSRASSLPRLPPPSARPSVTTSATDLSGSKKTGSSVSAADRQSAAGAGEDVAPAMAEVEEAEEALSPEEEEERRVNDKKCLRWLQGLPSKFSGMHIVQQTVYTGNR